jgi:NhaP-type Na+/H+ or K+/H+ antiporter
MEQIQYISLVIFAGIFSQVLANRLRLPAIVPLLIIGALIGRIDALDPRQLGDGLHTIVQLGVAIILFEGGLRLKIKQFREGPSIIRNLVSIGVLVTWILAAGAAYLFIPDLQNPSGLKIALLFGALITVSGPTVVMPVLKITKPFKKVATVLKWEGILIDPIGALLAVVILTFLNTSVSGYSSVVKAFVSSLSVGLVFGGVTAFMLYFLLKRTQLIREEMRNLMVLAMVLVAFSLSNWVQKETGILSVTVAGFVLGILRPRGLKDIESFKGQLTTLMVSILFILLAARLDLAAIWNLGLPGLLVLLAVLFIIRPLNVFLSGLRSQLSLREKLFVSWIAPRGIVAAAVASLFAETLKLNPEFAPQAGYIESLTFLIIGGTVFFQGATARFVGKLLKVTEPDPNGVVIIGANNPARQLAKELKKHGIETILIDSNRSMVSKAKKEGLLADNANALSQETIEEFEFAGFGKLLAMTPSEKTNILACQLWANDLGRDHVFRIGVSDEEYKPPERSTLSDEVQVVFPEKVTQQWLQDNLSSGWEMEEIKLSAKEETRKYQEQVDKGAFLPLVVIQRGKVIFYKKGIDLSENSTLICITRRKEKEKEKK